jgi:ArsR family transcriptional regulator
MTLTLTLKALADPTRLRIVNLLREGETCVGDLVTVLGVPQPTASRHLSHLRRAGIVVARERGRWCFYSLAPARAGFRRRLLDCLGSSLAEAPELARDLARARALRRAGGCCPEDIGTRKCP